jgi:hypothetical protein
MKTPFSIYLCGVLECIGGVLVLLMSLGMVFIFLARPLPPSGPGRGFMLASAGVYALMGALGVTTGICVCMRRNWARWSTLIFSWLMMLLCAFMVAVFLLMPFPSHGANPDKVREGLQVVKIASASLCLLVSATCGWWAWLFSRPHIKELFSEGRTGTLELRRPVSIAVIGWYWILAGAMMCAMATLPIAIGLWILTGWKAVAVKVVWGAAYILLGWGLLKLREWARLGSLWMIGFYALNALILFLPPGGTGRLQALLEHNPWKMQQVPPMAATLGMMRLGVAGTFLVAIIPLYFLITRKAAFLPVEAVGSGEIVPPPPPPEF